MPGIPRMGARSPGALRRKAHSFEKDKRPGVWLRWLERSIHMAEVRGFECGPTRRATSRLQGARVFDEKRVSSIRGGRTGATLRSKGKWFAVRAIKVAGERLFIAPDLM